MYGSLSRPPLALLSEAVRGNIAALCNAGLRDEHHTRFGMGCLGGLTSDLILSGGQWVETYTVHGLSNQGLDISNTTNRRYLLPSADFQTDNSSSVGITLHHIVSMFPRFLSVLGYPYHLRKCNGNLSSELGRALIQIPRDSR